MAHGVLDIGILLPGMGCGVGLCRYVGKPNRPKTLASMLVDELLRECVRMFAADTDRGPMDGRRDAVSIIM